MAPTNDTPRPVPFLLCSFVVTDPAFEIEPVLEFDAQLMIMQLGDHQLFTAGFSAMMHLHTLEEEVEVVKVALSLSLLPLLACKPVPYRSFSPFFNSCCLR